MTKLLNQLKPRKSIFCISFTQNYQIFDLFLPQMNFFKNCLSSFKGSIITQKFNSNPSNSIQFMSHKKKSDTKTHKIIIKKFTQHLRHNKKIKNRSASTASVANHRQQQQQQQNLLKFVVFCGRQNSFSFSFNLIFFFFIPHCIFVFFSLISFINSLLHVYGVERKTECATLSE